MTGTGGGTSIRHGDHIYVAPSGVQKEMMQPTDMFVMDFATRKYLRQPTVSRVVPPVPPTWPPPLYPKSAYLLYSAPGP